MDKILFEDLTQSQKEAAAIRRGESALGRVTEVQDRITGLDAATQRATTVYPAHRQPIRHGWGDPVWQPRRQTHRPDSDADVVILLRGKHRRFLPTKLAMADVAFDVLLETGVIFRHCPSGWTNGSIQRLSRILGC